MMRRAAHDFTREEILFIKKEIKGRTYAGMGALFNGYFGLRGKKKITPGQLERVLSKHGLRNGRDTRFGTGQVPHNKGKKGRYYAGCEKGWFASGHRPWNYRPPGSERLTSAGYIEVKIRDPKTWGAKHRVIWEKAHGKVPKGSVVIFADGNQLNVCLSNLLLVSRSELAVMNHERLISGNKDLTVSGKAIADIKLLIAGRLKKTKGKR
jgi:hypothetical protein